MLYHIPNVKTAWSVGVGYRAPAALLTPLYSSSKFAQMMYLTGEDFNLGKLLS